MNKISIITINYNNSQGLENTIKSVIDLEKIDENIEYLVIDGNSTDNSLDVIRKYSEKINYWVSESDTGIYNAMNKGIKKATGKYLLFLNSGDELIDNTSLNECLDCVEDEDIAYFNLYIQPVNGERWLKIYPDKVNKEYFINESLPHPATFFKKKIFEKYGLYDESLKICSDWTFYLKSICLKSCTYKHFNNSFSMFFLDGISSGDQNYELIKSEKRHSFLNLFKPCGIFYLTWFSLKKKIKETIKKNM